MVGLLFGAAIFAAADSVDPSQITKIEYSDLRELIKAGNFSYLQSQDSQNRQSAPYEKMHETLKEEYNYLKKMADSYKNDGDTEMQALYENNAKNIRTSMAQVQSTINRMNSASQEKTMEDLADTLFRLASRQQDLPPAAKAAQAEIHAGAQYLPPLLPAGMGLLHFQHIVQANVHRLLLPA